MSKMLELASRVRMPTNRIHGLLMVPAYLGMTMANVCW